jgi:hypothetical protein
MSEKPPRDDKPLPEKTKEVCNESIRANYSPPPTEDVIKPVPPPPPPPKKDGK